MSFDIISVQKFIKQFFPLFTADFLRESLYHIQHNIAFIFQPLCAHFFNHTTTGCIIRFYTNEIVIDSI